MILYEKKHTHFIARFVTNFIAYFAVHFTALSLTVCILLLSACTQEKSERNPGVLQVRLPWYSNSGYSLQTIQLKTVQDMNYLQGLAARFLLAPQILTQPFETQYQRSVLTGVSPRIHTIRTSDGIYIPEDFMSVEMLTLYAHFEKLQDFDRQSGLEELVENWPRQQTIVVSAEVKSSMGATIHDNAMYIGNLNAFLFPTYELQYLPLALNQAVIGHEYFHAIFYEVFIKQFGDNVAKQFANGSEQAAYHDFLIRGLNEGLADVWGWLYSGDYKFVSRSLPGFDGRDLDNPMYKVELSEKQIRAMSLSRQDRSIETSGNFYLVGSTYAQKIFSAVKNLIAEKKISEDEAKRKLARSLVKTAIRLSNEYKKLDQNQFLDPQRPLAILKSEFPEMQIGTK